MNKETKNNDKLSNYMGDPSLNTGFKYINTRASGLSRYFFERGIQTLFAWIPGPLGIIMRAVFYRPFFNSNSYMGFIEANTELFHMKSISLGKSVYIDKYCRLHASQAAIKLGNNNRVMRGAYLCTYVSNACKGEGIETGNDCWFGVNTVVSSGKGGIFLGNKVLIGPNVVIVTSKGEFEHNSLNSNFELIHHGAPINIGDNVIIYSNVVIVGGVKIGANSVIAAGSVVTKDVNPNTFAGGVPCKEISVMKF